MFKCSIQIVKISIIGFVFGMMSALVHADGSFTLREAQFEGLVRLPAAKAYALLSISAGDLIKPELIEHSRQQLLTSGYFDSVAVVRSQNDLVYTVVERPTISAIQIKGSKIPEDSLKKGLQQMGIAEGQVLKREVLVQFKEDALKQYAGEGYYTTEINITEQSQSSNQVDLNIQFKEGPQSKIEEIEIEGNHAFSTKEIRRILTIKEKNWVPFSKASVFSRERMISSMQQLTSLYLDSGYLKFNLQEPVISQSEDKKKIKIRLILDEGERYTMQGVTVLGGSIFPQSSLDKAVEMKKGDLFSQKKVLATSQYLKTMFANQGYYFADIKLTPNIDDVNKTVHIDYFIDQGPQVFVRRINFVGNTTTADRVLRQELRISEGALASNEKIDLSKLRLERTGYFKTVAADIEKVADRDDQIDITFRVEEQLTGSTNIALGYSDSAGATFQFGLSQSNFLGTGKDVSFDFNRSQIYDNYNFDIYEPYFTPDGVSQGYGLYYRKTKRDERSVSEYDTNSYGGNLKFGYPLNEEQRVSANFNVDNTSVRGNDTFSSKAVVDFLLEHDAKATPSSGGSTSYEAEFLTYNLNLNWTQNSLNRPIFPNKGMLNSLQLDLTVPGSDLNYQRLTASSQYYLPLGSLFTLRAYGKMGIGHDLPIYRNFFAGGYGSVRGFENGSLGPRSPTAGTVGSSMPEPFSTQEPVGGEFLAQAGTELILPMPFKGAWAEKIRPAIFVEGGQVYRSRKEFYTDELRYSAGIGFTWVTFIGPISWNYSHALNPKEGDQTKTVQFEIGRLF